MENTGYNLRQRPFPTSTTTDSLATIATSSVSILSSTMSYPPISSSSSSTGGLTSAPTVYAAPTYDKHIVVKFVNIESNKNCDYTYLNRFCYTEKTR